MIIDRWRVKPALLGCFLCVLIGFTSGAVDKLPPVDSLQAFENGVPAHVTVSKGKVSVSECYAQDGQYSLRWDWVPGDRLTIITGPLKTIGEWIGYGGYSRSAIKFKIFNKNNQDTKLIFRWLSGDKQGGQFDFPLHVEGWQTICYHYSWHHGITKRNQNALKATDRIVFDAPKTGSGTIYLDSLLIRKALDFRQARHPITKIWKPYDLSDYPHKELLVKATPEELAAVEKFLPRRNKSGNVKEKDVAKLEKQIREKYKFKRLQDGHLVGRGSGRHEMTGDMNLVAGIWRRTGDDALAKRVADVYFMLDDHFRTLGAVPQGSIGGLDNYAGRWHSDACFPMREPLLKTGRLEKVRNTLKYNYNYKQIFRDGYGRQSMDHHYNNVRYLFKIAVMHEKPEKIVKHLRIFQKRYNRQIIDTIKPDGSLYHHGSHYFAYAGGAMASTSDTFLRTMGTPFQPSQEAFEAVKRALLNMRYYANVTDLPVVMHGRHPGRQHLNGSSFFKMAEAGRGYNDGKLDPELAAAYLRLTPKDANKEIYKKENIRPEPAPQGNLAMNYAGLMGHRREEWLAMARGYGKYYWACESYNNANRHGLFFANGTLSLLATGNPVNIIDSGCNIEKGWDWRHFDGGTAIDLPYKQMANGNGTMSERSGVSFIGGLSFLGENGVFVMPIRSGHQYNKAMDKDQKREKGEMLEADKSYFFFDNRIVCLGAGIKAKNVRHNVHTTLFQNNLKKTDVPIFVDGKSITQFPCKSVLTSNKAHTLMDIQKSGYFIPTGQKIDVVRRHQKSRNGHDNKDTEGDAALAWLNHGIGPIDQAYEYVILPATTEAKLANFAKAMQSTKPPIQILQKNSDAHIVFDRATKSTGYVFFKGKTTEKKKGTKSKVANVEQKCNSELLIVNVSRPLLAMTRDIGKGRIELGLCDPDLHLDKTRISQPVKLSVTLKGKWEVSKKDKPLKTRLTKENNTIITIECHEARSYNYFLFPLSK